MDRDKQIGALDSWHRRDVGVIVGRKGHTAVVLLDRPEIGNAFGIAMLEELERIWHELDDDANVRCIVMAATSMKHFCTGRDLKEATAIGLGPDHDLNREPAFTTRISGVWKPLICALEGKAVGGGMDFALDADIVVAGRSATFMDPHVTVGQVAARGGLGLALKAGVGNALYLTLVGRAVHWNAERAYQLGLVQELVDDGNAFGRALELARLVGENSPSAVSKTMEGIWSLSELGSFEHAMRYTWSLLRRQRSHPDTTEGPRAFMERRPPQWK